MKKKIIIVVTLVVVLALGGTLAFAAVDDDGNWVNPFTNILSSKVEEGTITQGDMDTFNKVWEEIKGTTMRPEGRTGKTQGKMGTMERPDMDTEFMSELKEVMSQKAEEALNELVVAGVLTADQVEAAGDKGTNFMAFMKDADEETIAALKDAMTEVKDDITIYLEEKVADGTITQEQADMFSKAGTTRGNMTGDKTKGKDFSKRFSGGEKDTDESEEAPGA